MKNLKTFENFETQNDDYIRYGWHIRTKDVDDYEFYFSDFEIFSIEDLEKAIDGEFNHGDYFSVDGGGDDSELFDIYEEDPDDNSFVLIPKSDIIRIWSVDTLKEKKIKDFNL